MSSTPPPPPPPPPEFIINRFSSKPNDNRAPPLTDHGTISNRSITQPKRARKPQASGSMNQNITSGGPSKRNKPNRAQQPAKKGKAKARATRFPTETPGSSSQQFDGTLQVLSNPNEPEVPQQYVVPHQQNPNQAMPLTRHSYTVEPVSITETNGNISTLIGQIEQESNATLIYRERWQRLNNSPFPESIQNITLTDNMHLDLHRVLGPMIMSSFLIVSDCRHNNLNTGEAYTRRASTFFPYFWDVSINQLTCLTWEYVLSFELLGYEAPETPLKWIMTPRGSVIRIYDLCKVDPVLYAVRRQGKLLVANLRHLFIPGFIYPTSSISPPTTVEWNEKRQMSSVTFYNGSREEMLLFFTQYLDHHSADTINTFINLLPSAPF